MAGGSTAVAVAVTATSLPFASAVPGQSRWRPEGRRDLRRLAAASASTPISTTLDAMASGPSPAPTTHEGTLRTPPLSPFSPMNFTMNRSRASYAVEILFCVHQWYQTPILLA